MDRRTPFRGLSGARIVAAICIGAGVIGWTAPAAAQGEATLKSSFEGRRVVLRIDMPGTSDGVDLHVDSARPLDYQQYGNRLKDYGIAIRAGESSTVTLVKVKKDLIEFQLGGGGFGTFGDDTSTSVDMPRLEKSRREKELEKRVEDEEDSRRRRELRRELDDLRERRERENRRIDARRAEAEARKAEVVAERRLHGGSRFNLRYSGAVPSGIRPVEVMAALGNFVDFLGAGSAVDADVAPPDSAPVDLSPFAQGMPRKGMTRAEAERELGPPATSSERPEGGLTVTTLVFEGGDRRILAEFVGDVLVRYEITSR